MKASFVVSALLAVAVAAPAQAGLVVKRPVTTCIEFAQSERLPAEIGKLTIANSGAKATAIMALGYHPSVELLAGKMIAMDGAKPVVGTLDWSNIPEFGTRPKSDELSPDYRPPWCWPDCCPPPCCRAVGCWRGAATASIELVDREARASGVGNQKIVAEIDLEELWKGWNKSWKKKPGSEWDDVPDWPAADPEDLEEVPKIPKEVSIGGRVKGSEDVIGIYVHRNAQAYTFRTSDAAAEAAGLGYAQGTLDASRDWSLVPAALDFISNLSQGTQSECIGAAMSAGDAVSAVTKDHVSGDVTFALLAFIGAGYEATVPGPGISVGPKYINNIGGGFDLAAGFPKGWAR